MIFLNQLERFQVNEIVQIDDHVKLQIQITYKSYFKFVN